MTDHEEVLIRNNLRSVRIGRIVLWATILLGVIWCGVVSRMMFFPAEPATFLRAEIMTPEVHPTGAAVAARTQGSVRVRAVVDSPNDPECLIGTQYYIEFHDGTIAKLPGMRITTQGQLKEAIYEAAVPVDAPQGQAKFYVRDTYNCGIQSKRVESPHVFFTIKEAITNGRQYETPGYGRSPDGGTGSEPTGSSS